MFPNSMNQIRNEFLNALSVEPSSGQSTNVDIVEYRKKITLGMVTLYNLTSDFIDIFFREAMSISITKGKMRTSTSVYENLIGNLPLGSTL